MPLFWSCWNWWTLNAVMGEMVQSKYDSCSLIHRVFLYSFSSRLEEHIKKGYGDYLFRGRGCTTATRNILVPSYALESRYTGACRFGGHHAAELAVVNGRTIRYQSLIRWLYVPWYPITYLITTWATSPKWVTPKIPNWQKLTTQYLSNHCEFTYETLGIDFQVHHDSYISIWNSFDTWLQKSCVEPQVFVKFSCLANQAVNESVCNSNIVNELSLEAQIQSFICEFTVVVEILRCQFSSIWYLWGDPFWWCGPCGD
jgi:hypothetical protein